jgi:SHAQKYF class myb-like DNA-binding protein
MASAAVLKSARSHPKLLSLQHVDDAFLCSVGDAPMTPLGNDVPLFAATVSPRDPAAKLAAAASSAVSAKSPSIANAFVSHRVCIPSSASSDDASDDDDDDDAAARGQGKPMKANTGRWTEAEHKLFLQGLETFPYRAWKKIATLIKTRTVVQIRTHAQKYYQKLEKEEARLKEREAQDRAAIAAGTAPPCSPTSPSSQKKKMHLMRKRKCSMLDMDVDVDCDAVLPSVPKRLARELPLAAHMSPKQKMPSLAGNKVFFGNPMDARFMFGRTMKSHAATAMQPPHQLPLDFADAAAEAMILDFAEDKALADYSLDCVDQTLASIDNDDLLQLTEEELEWFSTSSTEKNSSSDLKTEAAAAEASPVEPFAELDTAALDGDNFAAELCIDDDDFVLDPEKFLSSYFGPNEQA